MPTEVHLVLSSREARLSVAVDGAVIDEERWGLPAAISVTEARLLATAVFDNVYDVMNYTVHGNEF